MFGINDTYKIKMSVVKLVYFQFYSIRWVIRVLLSDAVVKNGNVVKKNNNILRCYSKCSFTQ